MSQQHALVTVLRLDADYMYVQPIKVACAGCHGRCAKHFSAQIPLRLSRRQGVVAGDRLRVQLQAGHLLSATCRSFLGPALLLVLGLASAQWLGLSEPVSVALAASLALGAAVTLRQPTHYLIEKS